MTALKRTLYKNKNYFLVFSLGFFTAFLFFLPFLIYDKGLFLYYGDFDVQQIPFYSLCHEAIRNGNTAWNFNTDLGANFVGSYGFYLLGSPFFWLTIPFPESVVPYLMAPLLMLKFAFTAVTGFAFIKRFVLNQNIAMIGGMLYAFSGFNVYNIFFNHFNEVVMVFPLLLIALEELVINNRRGSFALAVALCSIINYYFFFGQVIFVVIYFFVRCGSKDFTITFKKFFILAFEAVIGLLISSVLLLPCILSILSNSRISDTITGFNSIVYGNSQRYGLILSSFFFPPDIPARPNFFPDSNAKWSSVSMFLPLFSTVGVFAYMQAAKKSFIKKILIICFTICFIPILNAAFSAFNYSYYARWFYMPLLIMALATSIALEKYEKHLNFGIKITSLFVIGFSFIGILPKKEDGKTIFFKLPEYRERFWIYVIIAVISIFAVILLCTLNKKSKHFFIATVASIMTVTVVYSSFMIFCGKQAGQGYDIVYNRAFNGREKLSLDESEFFRIDTHGELDNLGMFWRLPTINAFQSVVPSSIMDYYEYIGEERGVGSRPKPKYSGVRALTSVKYVFVDEKKDDTIQLGFSFDSIQNGYKVFKNDYFVPMGFTYDYFIPNEMAENSSKSSRDILLLKGILLEEKDFEKYKDILPVLSEEEAYTENLNEEDYFEACKNLTKNASSDFSYDKNGFKATITVSQDNLMFFSVPYDKGFTAFVNGEKTDILKVNAGFMAVKIPKGTSEIQFIYKTPGLKAGFAITGISLLILLCYYLLIVILRKKYPDRYHYLKHAHKNTIENSPVILTREAYILNITENED